MSRRKTGHGRKSGPSAEERSLIDKLAAEPDGDSVEVVLSPEEMACLRRLTGIDLGRGDPRSPRAQARQRKRTAELQVSPAELEYLRQIGGAAEPPPDAAAPSKPRKRTVDIVFTPAEIDFLRKLSGQELSVPSGAPLPVKELLAADHAGDEEVVLPVTGSEARWLDELTKANPSLASADEQRVRELREKIELALRDEGERTHPPGAH